MPKAKVVHVDRRVTERVKSEPVTVGALVVSVFVLKPVLADEVLGSAERVVIYLKGTDDEAASRGYVRRRCIYPPAERRRRRREDWDAVTSKLDILVGNHVLIRKKELGSYRDVGVPRDLLAR
ncbi:MAG: hypothetical protein JSU86_04830 [Phycisphaerales bacterium]|nr:MAG: hypothetical protein JSU86_04830 [Phycisphaerales bacterium]